MPNSDTLLEEADKAVREIEARYQRLSNIDEKEDLQPARDAAFAQYELARLKLLQGGATVTQADLEEMQALRQEVEQAAQTQTLIIAAGRFTLLLAKLAA